MSAVSFSICFRELLRDVCQHFPLAVAKYNVPVENDDHLVSVNVEVDIVKEDGSVESLKCCSSPCSSLNRAEEDAARRAVVKLTEYFSFEVVDFNLADKKFYENLYMRIFADHNVVKKKYKRLMADYNVLRSQYTDLLAEKNLYVAERKEMVEMFNKSAAMLQRSISIAPAHSSTAPASDEDAVQPPEFAV